MKKLLIVLAILAISVAAMAYTEGVDQSTVLADLTVVKTIVIDPDNPGGGDPGDIYAKGVWLQLGGTAPPEFDQTGGEFDTDLGNFTYAYNTVPKNFDFAVNVYTKVSVEISDKYQWLEDTNTLLSVEIGGNDALVSRSYVTLSDAPQKLCYINRGYFGTGGLTYVFEPSDWEIIPKPAQEVLTVTYTAEEAPLPS